MKKINNQSTAIFAALIQKTDKNKSAVLKSIIGPDLLITINKEHLPTTEGPGKVYQLSQSDPEGPERKVPEMLFIVIDNRQSPTDVDNLIIWPQRYIHDRTGLYIESIVSTADNLFVPIPLLYELTLSYGQSWLLSLGSKDYRR